jgi:hypothetical protein
MTAFVSETDLARARQDPKFRKKLIADNLDRLLAELNRLRNSNPDPNPKQAKQIREGVDLAVKLAGRLQKGDDDPGPQAA